MTVVLCAVVVGALTRRLSLPVTYAWLIGGLIVAISGLIDDVRGLGVAPRFGLQVLAALMLLWAVGGMPPLPMPAGSVALGMIGWLIGGLAIVWSINLFNFMDGIDGLAAAQSLFVASAGTVLIGKASGTDLPLLALGGASAAFLLWNLPKAKIFMGDVGSGFIGFALAAIAFSAANGSASNVWMWLALNGLFFVDATITLLARLLRGQRAYEAHRSHVYQRLSRRWSSHRAVTLTYSMINIAWCLPWAVATVTAPQRGYLLVVAELLPLCVFALLAGAGKEDVEQARLLLTPVGLQKTSATQRSSAHEP